MHFLGLGSGMPRVGYRALRLQSGGFPGECYGVHTSVFF